MLSWTVPSLNTVGNLHGYPSLLFLNLGTNHRRNRRGGCLQDGGDFVGNAHVGLGAIHGHNGGVGQDFTDRG